MDTDNLRRRGATPASMIRTAATGARVLLLVCAASLAPPCGGQVYKWVDEKGVTRYSETPPPGTKPQTLKPLPKSDAGEKGKPQAEPKSLQQQELEFRKRQIEAEEERQKQEAEDAKARRQAGLRREACIDARRDLAALQEQRPVFEIDEKGERRYLQDKERAETIIKAQQFIEKNCPK